MGRRLNGDDVPYVTLTPFPPDVPRGSSVTPCRLSRRELSHSSAPSIHLLSRLNDARANQARFFFRDMFSLQTAHVQLVLKVRYTFARAAQPNSLFELSRPSNSTSNNRNTRVSNSALKEDFPPFLSFVTSYEFR